MPWPFSIVRGLVEGIAQGVLQAVINVMLANCYIAAFLPTRNIFQ
eukprot:CAMPEP_0198596288 /NCGR_PEP_ID=MMETSP1462-20131121/142960_1 /TAXON_ID=1333877 /ORGANISM="Brandtodinium nutriculum, Strain RCC3387" /LENGTH=44 /DNA_ID= /DNA_START= /DNA_END= /DNA_ORIENTATION=